jgi:hypothetical protein
VSASWIQVFPLMGERHATSNTADIFPKGRIWADVDNFWREVRVYNTFVEIPETGYFDVVEVIEYTPGGEPQSGFECTLLAVEFLFFDDVLIRWELDEEGVISFSIVVWDHEFEDDGWETQEFLVDVQMNLSDETPLDDAFDWFEGSGFSLAEELAEPIWHSLSHSLFSRKNFAQPHARKSTTWAHKFGC